MDPPSDVVERYTKLKFEPLTSAPTASFFRALARRALDDGRGRAAARRARGERAYVSHSASNACVRVDGDAFDDVIASSSSASTSTNAMTIIGTCAWRDGAADVGATDRARTLGEMKSELLRAIASGDAESDCALMESFACVAHVCAKTWRATYWFAFPALESGEVEATPLRAMDSANERDRAMCETCEKWLERGGARAWIVSGDGAEAYALGEYAERNARGERLILAFADSSSAMTHVGWGLRNLSVLVRARWRATTIGVVCVRTRRGRVVAEACVEFTMRAPEIEDDESAIKVVGWERNARGKMGPRSVDLGATMDPTQLASQAVDLNLKLMRWRLLPELNHEKLASSKCLLIGAGTLGCAVARTLMGWGVREITFVDSGRVSYSNPARQSLFEFKDCVDGGAPKAAAAANKLIEIFPGMRAKGVVMSIPMPGHSVSDDLKAEVLRDVDALEALIAEHDVAYLLTDTRESRWLPTLICADKGTLCINAALGFNTYLVMRHGCGVDQSEESSRLGCYFCNDVMAPANSTKDRTLDQQCTVTRPGLAPLASALAVELMVALMHSSSGASTAPPSREATDVDEPSPLGVVPHQIRGSVAGFTQTLFDAPCFPRCTACSRTIVSEYRRSRDDFLMRAFNDPKTLEDLAGLTALLANVDADDAAWIDDDDFDDDDARDL